MMAWWDVNGSLDSEGTPVLHFVIFIRIYTRRKHIALDFC